MWRPLSNSISSLKNPFLPLRFRSTARYIPVPTSSTSMAQERGETLALAEIDEKARLENSEPEGDPPDTTDDADDMEPSEEERRTLRRVSDNIPIAAFAIVLVELCERFAFYGLSGPFQNYIQNPLPVGGNGSGAPPNVTSVEPAGALNMGQTAATGLNNMFSFLSYIFPILGAIIADAKWGRYKTITLSCFIYFIGLLITTATATPSALARGAGLPGWLIGTILVAAGTGGIKCNVSPLVADQYRKTKMRVETTPKGERVIVDPNVTITRIYNIFYWCINVGSLSSIATTELERRVGFWAAFLLPTCVFLLTPFLMVACSKMYYCVPPRGSVVIETFKVWNIALRGFWRNPVEYIREARTSGVWDRARPSYITRTDSSGAKPSWLTWNDEFVDEVKRTVRACEIFLFYPLYWIAYNQILTNLVSMAATMSTNGTPNDLLVNFDPIALIIFIPIVDGLVYPGLRRIGFVARPIFRIWLGFMLGAAAMVYSAVLQHFIYRTNPCGEFVSTCATPSSISVWVQVPAYILIAMSEIFASITGLEYSYNKAPKKMKSVVMAVYFFMIAIGNALNAALSPVAVDPKLVWNYTGIAVATFLAGNTFYLCFRHRDAQEEAENAIGRGKGEDSASADTNTSS